MKRLLIILFLVLAASVAKAEDKNRLYIEGATIEAGQQVTVSVNLSNTSAISAYQFDLVLPDGITLSQDEDGYYEVNLSTVRTTARKHSTLEAVLRPDGSIRIVCGSPSNAVFSGNDGEVATLTLNIAENIQAGSYSISLRNIILSTADSKVFYPSDEETLLTVKGEEVPLEDNRIFIDDATIEAGQQVTVSVNLSNTSAISAYQFDLVLPVGITLSQDEDGYYEVNLSTARTTARKHSTLEAVLRPDGSIRIVCGSPSNAVFSGNDGEVATLTLNIAENIQAGNYSISLCNIILSTADSKVFYPSDEEAIFTVDADSVVVKVKSYTREYGEANPTFEYIAEGATLVGQPEIICHATDTSPVGEYPIIIRKGGVQNYNDTYVNGVLTVTKAPLTIAAGTYTKKQGEAIPEFTLSYIGFKNNETKDVLTKQVTVKCEATVSSVPGEYAVTMSGAEAQNYDINYTNGILVVIAATTENDWFEISTDLEHAKWYNMTIRNYYYVFKDSKEPYYPIANATEEQLALPEFQWAFGGDSNRVIIYNRATGASQSLQPADVNGQHIVVLRDGDYAWEVFEAHEASGFALREAGTEKSWVNQYGGASGPLAFWVTSTLHGGDGSAFQVTPVPDILTPQNNVILAIAKGWNWISHNLAVAQPLDIFGTGIEEVKSQTKGVINDPKYGLFGNLKELKATEAYKVRASKNVTVPLSGKAFDARTEAVKLVKGWNWIGYPMDQIMTPDEALAKLSASEGDVLVGLSGSAEYVDGEWLAPEDFAMTPGCGYMLKVDAATDLLYNTSIVSKAAPIVRSITSQTLSPWSVDQHRYANVMPLRAQLYINKVQTDDDDFVVAAFCDGECRGIGKNVRDVLFMNVYGNDGDEITYLAYQKSTEEVFGIQEKHLFRADNLGSYRLPEQLNIGNRYDGIEAAIIDGPVDVSSMSGMLLRSKATARDLQHLPAGIYVVRGKKVLVK